MSDPFAPPTADLSESAARPSTDLGPVVFEVPAQKSLEWTASFHESHLDVRSIKSDKRYTYKRAELPKTSSLVFMPGGAIGITLRGTENVVLNIPKEHVPSLRGWIDPIADQMMSSPLRKNLPSRAVFTLLCLFFVAFDSSAFWIALAAWNASMFVAGLVKVHRIVLLAQAVFSFGLAAYFAYAIATGSSPWWIGIFALLIVVSGLSSLRLFRFYGMKAA